MTDDRKSEDELHGAVRKRAERAVRHEAEQEPTAWQNLSMIGSLGWLIVVPPLAGGLIGHWIDRKTGHPVLWAALLIFVGVVLGAWMAWRRANRE